MWTWGGIFSKHALHGNRGIALRIEIHQEHTPASQGEAMSQVNRGRRFTNAALLVCQDDRAHRFPNLRREAYPSLPKDCAASAVANPGLSFSFERRITR
mgnify:CR=1 FL=1